MADETVQAIKAALESYVRPREEAERIRRILALNLRSCHENGPQTGPLALAESDCTIKTTDVRGLQREYLKALHANIKAQRAYNEAVSHNQSRKEPKPLGWGGLNDAGRLEEHITTIKLKKKQKRLQTIERYLDILNRKPAADPAFLRPEEVFRDTRRLPDVPKAVVSGFAVDKESSKTDLKSLVDRLEKAVLRSRLLLKKEEQLLEEVKSVSTASPGKISDGAKMAALNAARNELISWMETELGKASAVGQSHTDDAGAQDGSGAKVDKATMDEQLALIKEKYANYVAARKSLIQLVAQKPQPRIKSRGEEKRAVQSEPTPPAPSVHLITPYVDDLLTVAHVQKASIGQKSHLKNILVKQTEDTGRALNRLAEESQLLPDHPTRRRQERSRGGDVPNKGSYEISNRVQPWVFAADSAKLATLEAVAEKIEEGQVALEDSTKYLAEIDQLLGRSTGQGDDSVDGDTAVDDIWLAETQTPRKGSEAPVRSKGEVVKETRDVWSTLDGDLGLINAEDSSRR